MEQIKFIAMDVDGTLLSSDKKILPKTKEILMKCQEKGIRLILSSGRPTSGLTYLATELEMEKNHGLLVSYNGSKVIDCETDEVLFNEPLSVEEGKAVLEHMKKFNVYPMIDKDGYMHVNNVYAAPIQYNNKLFNVVEYETRGNNYLLCEQEDLADFLDFELNKILTAGEPEYLKEVYQEMEKPFKDSLSCMFTSPFYFEFTAKGIDKAKALDYTLKRLGFNSENLIAFGDNHNDSTMLKYAHIGVAMGNAVDAVKEISDYITDTNDDEGIANALIHYSII